MSTATSTGVPTDLPTPDDVGAAAARIAGHVHRTPVLRSHGLDALLGGEVWFKCENLQRVGAFKARGATNAVLALPADVAARGVVTHSSGNHAAALALAARGRGVPAYVVMPDTASRPKVEAVRAYGAEITFCAPTQAAREATSTALVERHGATFVHPSDDPLVIAGQGTAARELLAEVADLDVVLTPVGGGGLLSGTCLAVAALRAASPDRQALQVVGAEPALADDAARSLATGIRQPQVLPPRSLADGLLTALGPRTFALLQAHGARVVTVEESDLVAAMRLVWERLKIVIEPSSAVPVAALLARRLDLAGGRAGVILSGGNLDLDRLPWLVG
jgi:threonine dehydratase